MPLPPSTTTFSGCDDAGVDQRERGALELLVDVERLDAPPRGGGRLLAAVQAGLDQAADVLDAGVAGQRDRPLAHELGAGVCGGVVRGRAHQPAVELARPHEVVEHLRAHLAGVDHMGALAHEALAVARGQLGRAQAHVASETDPQLGDGLAGRARQHPRERAADQLGAVAVELRAVQPADVIRLEYVRVDPHLVGILCARPRG